MSRTNIVLKDDLVKEGMRLTGIKTKRELVEYSLVEMIRREKMRGMLEFRGSGCWKGNLKQMRRGRFDSR